MSENSRDPNLYSMQPLAAAFAWSAYGFGLTARMFGMMSETFAAAASAGVEKSAEARAPEKRETHPAPKATAKVLPFESAAKTKPLKPSHLIFSKSQSDDLKLISGIGPKLEQMLNKMGISSLAQIAKWTSNDAARIDGELGLNGRVLRDDWAGQAIKMAEG